MTIPRLNVLANTTRSEYTLLSYPYPYSSLYTTPTPLANSSTLANTSILYDYSTTIPSGALSFSMNITSIPVANTTGTANFTFVSSITGEYVRGGVFLNGGNGGDTPVWLDRSHTYGFSNPFFTDKFSTSLWRDPDTQDFRLLGVLDRSILEVFVSNGERAGTMTFFPQGVLDTVILGTNDLNPGVQVSVELYGLRSTWAGEESGNATMTKRASGQVMRRDNLGHLGQA